MPATKFGAITSLSGVFASKSRGFKRSPWGTIRGFTQFKRNMQELAKVADSRVLIEGFTGIAKDIQSDMNLVLKTKLKSPTQKYVKSKKGKALWLREHGVVAKPFNAPGKSKAFVGINYRFGPHAHLIESGTQERYTRSGAYRGKLPAKGSKSKFAFFRPTINAWKSSGRFVSRVERAVRTAVDAKARGMIV